MKACKRCRSLLDGVKCSCGETSLSSEWFGYLIVEDPTKSKIARHLSIKKAGKYAIRVR